MGKSAASVQVKIVKGGGAGSSEDMECSAVFACFDPPIVMGSHEDQEKSREWQAEHVPPCSNMHVSGRGGPRIDGCGSYSTSKAMTWLVQDGQKIGAEHQQLTKAMREFAQKKGDKTLKQWMNAYEKAAKDVLKKRPVTKDAKKYDKDSLAAAAAKCIRDAVDASFEGKVAQNTPLRNGQARGKPPAAPSATTKKSGGLSGA